MSNSRARTDFPRIEQGLVDKFMGTAYDRMLEVYEHVDAFEALYEVLLEIEDVATYVANKKVDAAIKEMVAYLQDLELRMLEKIKEEGDKYTNKFDEYVKYIEDLVSNIRTDFIVQETGKGLDVAMSQDATTRELNKKWDIQKTQGKGDLIRYSLLKEVEDNAKNEYDNIYTVINRVDEKRITSEKELKVEIADSKSSISRVEDVMVTEFRAQAEVNTKIESSLGDAKGSIITIEKTMADNNKAQASKNELLESSIRGNTASISNLSETVASDREVSASQVNELKAEVRDSKSSITALNTVVANDRKAIANQFNELESTIGSNTASITSLSETVATNHQVSVNQYNTLKGEVDQNFGLIEDLNEVIVTGEDVTAQKLTQLKTELNKNIETETGKIEKKLNSEITRVDKAVSDLDKSTAEATLNLKTEVNSSITKVDKKVDTNKKTTDASIIKNKNDAVKESKDFTILSVTEVDTRVTSEINQINKTISEMDNASAESVTQLKAELEREITTTNTKIDNNKKATDADIAKAKKDSTADSKKYTDQQITVVNTKIGSEITNVNKTITELEKTSAEANQSLKSELQTTTTVTNKKIDKVQADLEKEILETVQVVDTRNTNEPPSYYYKNYPRRIVNEFKSGKIIGVTTGSGYADLRSTVSWQDNSGGHIYQDAFFLGKTFTRYGGARGTADVWTAWVEGESIVGSQAKANKAKLDAIKDSGVYTDKEILKIDTKLASEIKTVNKTITDLEKTTAENQLNLKSEMEQQITAAVEIIYLSGTVKAKNPKQYLDEYGRRTVVEFATGNWFTIGNNRYQTVSTEIAYASGLDQGRITQRAVENFKSDTPVVRERKSASDTTWTAWVISENTSGSQAKSDKAKADAIAEGKKYTDAETVKLDNKVSAEIEQTNTTVAKVNGEVSAMTRMTATTTANGKKVVSGLQFGSNGTTSDFKIMADKFTVVSVDGSAETQMFTAKKVGNKTEFVVNGKIRADQVEAGKLSGMELIGGSLNVGNGKFTVSNNGVVDIRADTTRNVGMRINNDRIDVYDANGRLRVRLGKLR